MPKERYGALYMRLSRDENHSIESESISNQRHLLMQYASAHHIHVAFEFSDDGITGTTQNRKGLQSMFRAIEDGLIDTVLVKDLSRLSRNYIHTGELVEEWFPSHGVRLISVDDSIDTAIDSPSNDIFAIRAVMDDWYARDISRKVRAAIYAKQRAGYCTASHLPFGYEKSGSEIIVNCAQSETVKKIYREYENGVSCCGIAKVLRALDGSNRKWNDTTVRRILTNPAYTGRLHLHISEKVSYKSNRRVLLPSEEIVIYPIPRIISDEQFIRIKQIMADHRKTKPPKHWLCGKVYCAVCGAVMHVSGFDDGRIVCSSRKRFQNCTASSVKCRFILNAIADICRQDGIPYSESLRRRLVSAVRISPDQVVICMRYKKPEYLSAGGICEL